MGEAKGKACEREKTARKRKKEREGKLTKERRTMATTASVWAKPGAWALEAEESEALERMQQEEQRHNEAEAALSDFPSLSAAAASKPARKKKAQTLSLSEFTTGKAVTHGSAKSSRPAATEPLGLTPDELLLLPTGPRERSPEELERGRLGGGFRSYGRDRDRDGFGSGAGSAGGERGYGSESRREAGGVGGGNRDFAPSRADEIDDWGASKKPLPERRERGFFESQSKADESDNWSSNKSRSASFSGGFGGHREREGGRPRFEMFGGGAASDSWGRKAEDSNGSVPAARPRLVLQPRTLALNRKADQQQTQSASGTTQRPKGANPFGEARPREEVLAEKGQDWKKIEEKLESAKIKDADAAAALRLERNDGSFGRKGFGNGRADSLDDKTERSWKKPDLTDGPARMADAVETTEGTNGVEGPTSN